MPRALKLCVGFCDSSLMYSRDMPSFAPRFFACSNGVNPSPNETMFDSCSTGSTSR